MLALSPSIRFRACDLLIAISTMPSAYPHVAFDAAACFLAAARKSSQCSDALRIRPTVLTPEPCPQKGNPVPCRSRPKHSCCMRLADWPLRHPTVLATLYVRGMLKHRWICSGFAGPSTHSTLCCGHRSHKIRPILCRRWPYHTRCLYVGTKIRGYLPYQRT
jgi:hypothetical protein